MKLYEVNQQLEELLAKLEPDAETGEILADDDSIFAEIDALQMERKSILEYLAKLVLNSRAEESALKEEEKRLAERRKRIEKKEDRLLSILDRECGGENTDCGVATMYYRKTTRVDVTDYDKALVWLQNNHEDFIRYSRPEISKTDVKKLLNGGTEIPGVSLVHDLSHSLR